MSSDRRAAYPGVVIATTVAQSLPLWGELPMLLADRGIDVHLVASEAERPEWIPAHIGYTSIPMHRGVSPLADARAMLRWHRLLRSLRPRVIVAATPKAGTVSITAALAAGVPVRHFHVWGCRWDRKKGVVSALARLGDAIASVSATKIFAVGPQVAELFSRGVIGSPTVETFPYPGSRGVDLAEFAPSGDAPVQRPPTIGFLGRLTADKGFFFLPSLLEGVRRQVPNAQLVIAGRPDRPSEAEVACRELSGMQGVAIAGHVRDVPKFLRGIDVLCFPSIREGLPNAVIEAAACGVPTVGWQVTGLGDAVIDGTTGYLAPAGDVDAMVKHLTAILSNPDLRQSLSRAARQCAEERFDHRLVQRCQLNAVLDALGIPPESTSDTAATSAVPVRTAGKAGLARVSIPTWPVFADDEVAAVRSVLHSGRVNYWTGTVCRDFEDAWSRHLATGLRGQRRPLMQSICMANGTLTLDAALHALGIGPGDEVIVSPRTYVASAMSVVMSGATPVFADVDPDSGCITPETAEAVRSPRTRAVMPVHVGGWPCDMPAICEWAQRYGIEIIEDCAQAHGAHIEGQPVGTFGRAASWSFCQDKIITTGGEGGMLSVRDPQLLRRCWSYAQHGKDHDQALDLLGRASAPGFKWLVEHRGTNCRMTEMQAAIGLLQLSKLPQWIDARRRNAAILGEALAGIPGVRLPSAPPGHAYYRFTCYIEGNGSSIGTARDAALRELHYAGLPASVGSCGEVYLEPYFQRHGMAPLERLPVARQLADTSLALLCHPTIGPDAMMAYAAKVREVLTSISSAMALSEPLPLHEARV